jgi:hypothetical protein
MQAATLVLASSAFLFTIGALLFTVGWLLNQAPRERFVVAWALMSLGTIISIASLVTILVSGASLFLIGVGDT